MATMKSRVQGVALAGGIGGLANAMACYFHWPVAVPHAEFHWHLLPAGLLHGSVLAALPVAAATLAGRLQRVKRWALALPVGWVAGYASWIALDLSAFSNPFASALVWPFREHDPWFTPAYAPILYFGGVAVLLYLWESETRAGHQSVHAIWAATLAAMLGSLWFWIAFEAWYLSLLHGAVWGSLVGFALSKSATVR